MFGVSTRSSGSTCVSAADGPSHRAPLRDPHVALRAGVAFAASMLLAACASNKPAPPPPEVAVHPRSVAIIPVLRAEDLTINRRSPLVFLGLVPLGLERLDRYQKQQTFEKRLEADRFAVSQALTEALRAATERRGFTVHVLNDIQRDPADPNDFDDYRRIETDADIIIHARVSDIGLMNFMTSKDYEPYVDVKVRVVAHESGYELLDENLYYGANGSRGDPFAVPSDPTDRWGDFDTVITQADAVGNSWIKGANALGERIAGALPPSGR